MHPRTLAMAAPFAALACAPQQPPCSVAELETLTTACEIAIAEAASPDAIADACDEAVIRWAERCEGAK